MDVKIRSVVTPVQEAPANKLPHILTVNVVPPLAVTPHTGVLVVPAAVFDAENAPHELVVVG